MYLKYFFWKTLPKNFSKVLLGNFYEEFLHKEWKETADHIYYNLAVNIIRLLKIPQKEIQKITQETTKKMLEIV